MSKSKGKPKQPRSAAQQAALAALAEKNRSRRKVVELPEPAFAKGDRVLIKPTAEHPVSRRGIVDRVVEDAIFVNVAGYVVRYREHQLLGSR